MLKRMRAVGRARLPVGTPYEKPLVYLATYPVPDGTVWLHI